MANTAARQKTRNSKGTVVAANGSVKPANATEIQVTKVTTTAPATPTRVMASTSKNSITKPNVSCTANGNNSTKPFVLADITVLSVLQARQIRKMDFERFVKLHNYFTAVDDSAARPINSKASAQRDQVDGWIRAEMNPKAFECVQENHETHHALLALLVVSAALAKYGEQELGRRDTLGEMDTVVGARFGTSGLPSKQPIGESFEPVKKNGAQTQKSKPVEKKHLPAEVKALTGVGPPPAPVLVKAAAADIKKEVAPKNATPMNNVIAGKSVSVGGAWGGPIPASVMLSLPGPIVSSAPTVSARVRANISR